jgi:hypothetical protein
VISACSAAEVALSTSARSLLLAAGRIAGETTAILDRVAGVVELYRLNAARPAGLDVSIGQVMAQLANPRNRATSPRTTRSSARSVGTVHLSL